MSEKTAKALLASVILARSSSYVLQKLGLTDIDVFNLMGIRFLMAFFIMVIFFHKKMFAASKRTIRAGMIIGMAYFVVMSFEVFSLKTCESSTTAFLENTAITMVPLFEALLARKLPQPRIAVGFIMATAGVALMSLQRTEFSPTIGYVLAMGAAITYTAAIIITDRVSKNSAEPLIIGIIQLGTMGTLSTIASFIFEVPHFPSNSKAWLAVILLAIVCSCFGFTLQPVAQKYTSVETAGLYCAFGPLGAGIFGWICLGEALSFSAFVGAAMILLSILMIQKSSMRKPSAEQK